MYIYTYIYTYIYIISVYMYKYISSWYTYIYMYICIHDFHIYRYIYIIIMYLQLCMCIFKFHVDTCVFAKIRLSVCYTCGHMYVHVVICILYTSRSIMLMHVGVVLYIGLAYAALAGSLPAQPEVCRVCVANLRILGSIACTYT